MASPLFKEFDYYLKHQNEIVEHYEGKYIVIKDNKVIGAYENELLAIETTQEEHELGTFLVQYVSQGTKDYTATFHTRATFS